MGKSTFGNFLFDPDSDQEIFVSAKDNKPMTQHVQIESKRIAVQSAKCEDFELTIIDTPGLNENAYKDLSHMIKLIKALQRVGKVQACILVAKFDAKIDAQFKATMEYYSELLPALFQKNVILVLTGYASDDRSEKIRVKQGIDVEQMKCNIVTELISCSKSQLDYSPVVFTIDCLPLDGEEKELSLRIRTSFLEYIHQLTPIAVKNIKVAKTAYIKAIDAGRVMELEGKINVHKEGLKAHNMRKQSHQEAEIREMKLSEVENSLLSLTSDLEEFDTSDEVIAGSWSIDQRSRQIKPFIKHFSAESPHKITRIAKWTDGHCQFENIVKETPNVVKGILKAIEVKGLCASLILYTEKRIKNAEEINELKKKIEEARLELKKHRISQERLDQEFVAHDDQRRLLQRCISESRKEIAQYIPNLMSLDDAIIRLNELRIDEKQKVL